MGENQPSDADWTVTVPFRSAVAMPSIQRNSGVWTRMPGKSQTMIARITRIAVSRNERDFFFGFAAF